MAKETVPLPFQLPNCSVFCSDILAGEEALAGKLGGKLTGLKRTGLKRD